MVSVEKMWLLLVALVGSVGCGAEGMAEEEPVDQTDQALDMNRFKGWQSLPFGIFLGAPAVLNVDGNLNAVDVYGQGSDNAIWYARRTSATAAWVGWGRLDEAMKSRPAATMFGSNRALVATGSDDNVWIRSTQNGSTTFKAWERIPDGEFSGAPAITYLSPYLFVISRKASGDFYWTRNDVSTGLDNRRWTAWRHLGCCSSSEAALTATSNRIIFAVRASVDNRIWFAGTSDAGETWLAAKAVGTMTFRGPPAISWHNGGLDVTARDSDDLIWVATANGATGATDGWKHVPGALFAASAPGTAANKAIGRFAVATRRSDQTYAINFWE